MGCNAADADNNDVTQVTAVVQDPTAPPLYVVSEGYLSFAMDMSFVFGGTDAPVQEMYVDWNNTRLRNAVKMVRTCICSSVLLCFCAAVLCG